MSAKLQCNPSSLAIICCVAKAAITLICYECICGRNDPLLNSQINKPYLWLYSFYSWTKCCHILELTRTVTDHILWRSLHSVSLCLLLALFRLQVWKHPTCITSHGQFVDCRQDTHMEHCSNHIFIMPDGLLVQATCSLFASPAALQSYSWSLCRDWAAVWWSLLPAQTQQFSPDTTINQNLTIPAAGLSTEQARG